MMKRLLSLLALLLAAAPAQAELAGGDAPRIVEISEKDCRHIAPYLPGGADYVPGVAADGSAVAPADLGGGYGYGLRPVYEFDATLDPLVGRNPAFNSATEMTVARIAIDMVTGRVTIDGQDVTGLDHSLAEACARLHHPSAK
ncbi:MAG: hypothetical protein LPK88_12545 [Alphaproteobacteria bacterium]|mgnify:CR=1 FL=1|nr:hypothetical protein [Alphaproteobacteria bacterium]MDX5417128.1 hypothetical protein [Alphaproteobacteria bacterium]MDX5494555.1 hypothetical protein [Alphaproteobacteria bacterium]